MLNTSSTASLITKEMPFWHRKSTIILSSGFVGCGLIAGAAGAIYFVSKQLNNKINAQNTLVRKLESDIECLKSEIRSLKIGGSRANSSSHSSIGSNSTNDDEEYLTCDEDETEEAETVFKRIKKETNEKGKGDGDGDNSNSFYEKIDGLLQGTINDKIKGYKLLKSNKKSFQNSSEFWWRFAKAEHIQSTIAEENGNKALKKDHLEKAVSYAEKSVKMNDLSSEAHKWYAITCGAMSDYLPIKEKIKNGYKFKEHVDRAIQLNPKDNIAYYLLGRFCLEVSSLSWIERKVASTIFSNPPSSSPHEALKYFVESEKITPFIENRFYMAKCFLSLGDKQTASVWLDRALEMPVETALEKLCSAQIKELKKKL